MGKVAVYIVSNFILLRAGLVALLNSSPNVQVVGDSDLQEDTAARVCASGADVAILEIEENEQAVFQAIKALCPETRVIVVSRSSDPDLFLSLLRAGVNGCLSEREAPSDLARAVDAVSQGEVFLCTSASHTLLDSYRAQARARGDKPRASEGV